MAKVEIKRVPSPDGFSEAVLYETNPGGATTAFVYTVAVAKADAPHMAPIVVAVMDKVSSDAQAGPVLRWEDAHTLVIEYQEAQIFSFQNSAWLRTQEPFYRVGVRLSHPAKGFLP